MFISKGFIQAYKPQPPQSPIKSSSNPYSIQISSKNAHSFHIFPQLSGFHQTKKSPLNHQPCQKYHIPMMSYPKNDQQSINPHDPSQPRHLRRRAAPPPPGPSKRPRGLGRVGAPPGDLHDLETRYGEWTQPWDFNGIFLISWDISTITMVI